MSYRSSVFFRYVFAPLLAMLAYIVILYAGMALTYTLEGEAYTSHMGEVQVCGCALGVAVLTAWILIKRRLVLPGPRWALGKPYDWGFAVIGALAILGISMLYMFAMDRLPFAPVKKAMEDYSSQMNEAFDYTKTEIYLSVLASCLLAPVVEEMIFRGCVLEGMLQLKHPYFSIVLSSVYFGVMHVQPIQIGYAIVSGICLGLIYYYTKNICMSIFAHIIFNCLGSGIYLLFDVSVKADRILLITEIASIAVFAVAAFFMARIRNTRFPDELEESGDMNKMLPGRHT